MRARTGLVTIVLALACLSIPIQLRVAQRCSLAANPKMFACRQPPTQTNGSEKMIGLVRMLKLAPSTHPPTLRAFRLAGSRKQQHKRKMPQLAMINASKPFPRRVAMLSTYPPTRCGIATYAMHLRSAILDQMSIAGLRADVDIIEMLRPQKPGAHEPPAMQTPVVFQIRPLVLGDYRRAARFVEEQGYSLVLVHHEFGLFGGNFGDYLRVFIRELPPFTWRTLIMHTFEPDASTLKHHVFRSLLADIDDVVGLSEPMCTLVRMESDTPPCYVIEHGVPALVSGDYAAISKSKQLAKLALGLPTDGKLLLSAGLLRDGKGLETIVSAMPAIAGSQPSLRLLIAGKTHPAYVEATGVRYDTKLRQLAQDLDVSDRLILRHTYLSDLALEQYMVAADLYVAPYSYLGQTSSGMVPLAMSAGCVVVSSPFLHAISLLGEGRGVVTPANHPSFLSLALIDVLDDSAAFEAKAERATAYSRRFIWPAVGQLHVQLMQRSGQWRWSGRRFASEPKDRLIDASVDASEGSYLMQLGNMLFSGLTAQSTLHITPLISGLVFSPVGFTMAGCFLEFNLQPINGTDLTRERHSHRIGSRLVAVTLDEHENRLVLRDQLNLTRLDGSSVVVGVTQTVRSGLNMSAEERLAGRHDGPDFEIHTHVSLVAGERHFQLSVQRITMGFEFLSSPAAFGGVHERNSVTWVPQERGGGYGHERELLLPKEVLTKRGVDQKRGKCEQECSAFQRSWSVRCTWSRCKGCIECSRDAPPRLQLAPARRPICPGTGCYDRIAQISIHTTNSSVLKDRLTWTPDREEDWYSPEDSELVVSRDVAGNVHYVRLDYNAPHAQPALGDVRLVNRFAVGVELLE